jgi:hypothetical protein
MERVLNNANCSKQSSYMHIGNKLFPLKTQNLFRRKKKPSQPRSHEKCVQVSVSKYRKTSNGKFFHEYNTESAETDCQYSSLQI